MMILLPSSSFSRNLETKHLETNQFPLWNGTAGLENENDCVLYCIRLLAWRGSEVFSATAQWLTGKDEATGPTAHT